ncbi:MAG: translational GTPase TypA [Myxococcota bacterium]|nr:translational GTPase TypA [Myxococcota bacterium]
MDGSRKELRNVAIIAHVDHGKTTLLDGLLRQTGALGRRYAHSSRVMDTQDLERERGITILSKFTAIDFEGIRIQIFDTPGHADFGGEVERVLGMVDGCLLLVDAVEGVMPQTRFVLRKALDQGLLPILVVNKIDRPEHRAEAVVDEVFDLLVELGASDRQLEFPILFSVAKEGTAVRSLDDDARDLRPLLETLLERIPEPDAVLEGPLQFQAVTLDFDEFLGRLVIGRVARGTLERGANVVRLPETGPPEAFRVTKLLGTRGLERSECERAHAGEIVFIAGINHIEVGDTICDPETPEPLPRIPIDPATVSVRVSANTSPFAGREGRFLTSRQIGDRLRREALGNVSINVDTPEGPESFEVSGRGELQIAILIETLRRESFEFSVSRPEIIQRKIDGKTCEPVEDVAAEVPEECVGVVVEKLSSRRGRLLSMEHRSGNSLLCFVVPSRGMFGYRSEFLTDTRGEGVLHRTVRGYEPLQGELEGRGVGAIVATDPGKTTAYALFGIQERANMFVGAGIDVYEGQVVGENRRPKDMNVNVCRGKKLTNIRAAGKDEATVLKPARPISIESALEWIDESELLEVTPGNLRLRKKVLPSNLRKR